MYIVLYLITVCPSEVLKSSISNSSYCPHDVLVLVVRVDGNIACGVTCTGTAEGGMRMLCCYKQGRGLVIP